MSKTSLSLIGMEESGSEGLDDLVKAESVKGGYFEGVDCACIVRWGLCALLSLKAHMSNSRTITG